MTDNSAPSSQRSDDLLASPHAESSSLYQRVAYSLQQAGFNVRLDDEDQVIVFTFDDDTDVVIMCDEEPSSLIRLFGQWAISEKISTDETLRLRAAMRVSEECKLAKVFLSTNSVISCVDHLVSSHDDIVELVGVCVAAMFFAIQQWHEALGLRFDDQAEA